MYKQKMCEHALKTVLLVRFVQVNAPIGNRFARCANMCWSKNSLPGLLMAAGSWEGPQSPGTCSVMVMVRCWETSPTSGQGRASDALGSPDLSLPFRRSGYSVTPSRAQYISAASPPPVSA